MLKKTITYKDYKGLERTEDFYFNFTKAELMEMELSIDGGLTEYMEKIIAAKSSVELIKIFKKLVLEAYGEKSADGKRFMKSEEIRTAFSQTEAYSIMFMELVTDDNAAANFMNAVIPDDIDKKALEQAQKEALEKANSNTVQFTK